MELITYFIDFFLHLDKHLAEIISSYQTWTYIILFIVVFAETGLVVTPFLPGDSLLFAAGTLTALNSSPLNIHLLALTLIAATFLGDNNNYFIGRFLGKKIVNSKKIKLIKQQHLDKTHQFYEKYGTKTVIIARFIPIVRTFSPFVAGVGLMNYIKFLSFSVAGAILWILIFMYGGYLFGNIPFVKKNFSFVVISIILISVFPIIIEFIKHKRVSNKN